MAFGYIANVIVTNEVLAYTSTQGKRVRMSPDRVTASDIEALPTEDQARVIRRLARLRESGRKP